MEAEVPAVTAAADLRPAAAGRISVVIPAYNAAAFLGPTLETILGQTVRAAEIIVVDDGSTDGTPEIARSFAGVTVIEQSNSGPAAARNRGTLAATGEFIAYLDADDLWAPDKLERQLAALEAFGKPAFSFTDYRMFDASGFRKRTSELGRYEVFRRVARRIKARPPTVVILNRGRRPVLYDTSYIAPSSVLIRRADVLAAGGFDESLRYCEDYEFFLRVFRSLPAVVVMLPLLHYRQHAGQGTSKTATRMRAGHFDVARLAAAQPARYPQGDVRYLARTDYLRHYRLGILHGRLGQFDECVTQLAASLAARWTAPAAVLLAGAKICRSGLGRRAFDAVRAAWRNRPGRR
jgi:glycosyltransferase involved in cell wall biosynthesis